MTDVGKRSSSARQPMDNHAHLLQSGRKPLRQTERQRTSRFFKSGVRGADSCSSQNEPVLSTTQDGSTASESSYARRKRYFKYRNCGALNNRNRKTRQCRILSYGRRRSRRLRMRRGNNDQPERTLTTPVRADHLVQSATVYKAIKKLEKVDESKRPSELIRRDFISAMKLPDRHVLTPGEYWTLKDKWRAAWDRGVHVPVSALSARETYRCRPLPDVTPPRRYNAYMRSLSRLEVSKGDQLARRTSSTTNSAHVDRDTASVKCLYDVDATDLAWLGYVAELGFHYSQDQFERHIIALEFCCAEEMRQRISQCLTFDRNVVCDVCRSPEASEGDEMVFCDGCDVCVHQSCYGICQVPRGEWRCSPCSEGLRAGTVTCILCGSCGGALKPVKEDASAAACSGLRQWCHLCCALWIPETKIADLQTMEPVICIDCIPAARWALVCYLCRTRQGACVQCSLPSCRKAFHVTCALQHNLRIDTTKQRGARQSLACRGNDGENSHGRKSMNSGAMFVAFCEDHSEVRKTPRLASSKSGHRSSPSRHGRKESTKSPANKFSSQSKRRRLTPQKIAKQFHRCVDVSRLAFCLRTDIHLLNYTYQYWVFKRKQNQNKPLIGEFPASNSFDTGLYVALCDYLGLQVNSDKFKISLIVLRQDLEIARNLCYLVLRRERLKLEASLLSINRLKLYYQLASSAWPIRRARPGAASEDLSPERETPTKATKQPSRSHMGSRSRALKRTLVPPRRYRYGQSSDRAVSVSKRLTRVRRMRLVAGMEGKSNGGERDTRPKRARSNRKTLRPLSSSAASAKRRRASRSKRRKR